MVSLKLITLTIQVDHGLSNYVNEYSNQSKVTQTVAFLHIKLTTLELAASYFFLAVFFFHCHLMGADTYPASLKGYKKGSVNPKHELSNFLQQVVEKRVVGYIEHRESLSLYK